MSVGDRNFWKKKFLNSMAEQQHLAEINGTAFDVEAAMETAEAEANYATFNEDSTVRELMSALKEKGVYELTADMKEQLSDFAAGYATEQEVKEKIAKVYGKTGYVLDTHTAVAASVYEKYQKETGDYRRTVIASTASPYKFARSVMTSIDEKYDELEEFDLIDTLEVISGVDVPNAIEEIRNAQVRHTMECDADKMEETVKAILKVERSS